MTITIVQNIMNSIQSYKIKKGVVMLTINNNPNSVFCPPEPGKPNPNEPRIPGQLRSRVVRQRQKGDTCVYYGLQILLDEAKNPKNERSRGEQLLSNHRKEIIAWTERWEPIRQQTATHVRAGLLHGLYVRVAKEVYGLEISSWNPEQPITALIKELQLHGPHLVLATLGKPIYITSPIPLKDKIEGRTIFGWTPNAARLEGSGSHTIVVVGAEVVNNRGYVYFVDPDTVSSDRNSQEIFKVSYERLLSSINDLRQRNDAFRRQQIQQGNAHIAPFVNEYALYCPKK
jgi:hypothetical protein